MPHTLKFSVTTLKFRNIPKFLIVELQIQLEGTIILIILIFYFYFTFYFFIFLFSFLKSAFLKFTDYHTPTNALLYVVLVQNLH
jgi:hypothetical protein